MTRIDADPYEPRPPGWRMALVLAGFWTAVALVFVLPHLSGSATWRSLLPAALAQWWAWGLLTPIILAVNARLPFSSRQWLWRIAAQLLLGAVCTLLYALLEACLAALLRADAWSRIVDPAMWLDAMHGMFWSLLVYGLIVGVGEAQRYQRHYAQAELHMARIERSFTDARLHNLRAQLDPHFLFNALNTISSQAEREPKLARKMIEHLGDLLRMSLSSQQRQTTALAEELSFLEHYLAIQKIRFGDDLRVHISVEPGLERALVPSLMIQPLVENAIRHGLSPRAGLGQVWLDVVRVGEAMRISVRDDGVGLPANGGEKRGGLGLATTRERLAGLYAQQAHMTVRALAQGGAEVEILLPLHWSEAAHA